jgi:hypothetical protein
MEISVLPTDLTGSPHTELNSESVQQSEISKENGMGSDFLLYFSEISEKDITDKSDNCIAANLLGSGYKKADTIALYDEYSFIQGLSPELLICNLNSSKLDDTYMKPVEKEVRLEEISAADFLTLAGLSIQDIDIHKLAQPSSDLNSFEIKEREKIKAIDFLKNLGFSEGIIQKILSQVLKNNLQIGDANRKITSLPILTKSGDTINISDHIKDNTPFKPLERAILSDSVTPIKTLKEIKDLILGTFKISEKNLDMTPETAKMPDEISPLPAGLSLEHEEDSKKWVRLDKNSDNGKETGARIMRDGNKENPVEGKESIKGFMVSDGDKFSLPSKEMSITKITDSTGNPEIKDISQSQKPLLNKGIINQLVEKAHVFLRGERNEIKIHLEPPSLGSVNVKVTMESQNMKAIMVTETHYVKEVIESNLSELKNSLSCCGIKIDQFSVFVGQGYGYKNMGHNVIQHREDNNTSDLLNATKERVEIKRDITSQNIINIFI